ncbi:MAG: hypothetical protein AAF652_20850 [Cyanobacteria bacterium P01_C01_bin.72]
MEKIKQRLIASSALIAGFVIFSPVYQKLYRLKSPCFQKYHQPAKLAATTHPSKFDQSRREYRTKKSTFTRANDSVTPIGMAISPDGREIYRLTKSGISIFNRNTGEYHNFDLPLNFPRLSWGTDLAYDSRRDLVSLVSFGGEGYLYRFDARQRRWLDVRSLDNIDLKSLTYERTLDRYVAQVEDFGMNEGNLVFISGDGELLQQENREGLIKELY